MQMVLDIYPEKYISNFFRHRKNKLTLALAIVSILDKRQP